MTTNIGNAITIGNTTKIFKSDEDITWTLDDIGAGGGGVPDHAKEADKLSIPRTIALTGDATGEVTFDGSTDVSTVVALSKTGVTAGTYNSVALDDTGRATNASYRATGFIVSDAKTNASVTTTNNDNTFFNIVDGYVSGGSPGTVVDSSFQVKGTNGVTISNVVGTLSINGPTDISGNSATADKLKGAKTIALSGGVTGTATPFDGSANITIPVTAIDATKLSGTAPINITGSASEADKLAAAQKISFTGYYQGNTNFDGSGPVSIALTPVRRNTNTGTLDISSLELALGVYKFATPVTIVDGPKILLANSIGQVDIADIGAEISQVISFAPYSNISASRCSMSNRTKWGPWNYVTGHIEVDDVPASFVSQETTALGYLTKFNSTVVNEVVEWAVTSLSQEVVFANTDNIKLFKLEMPYDYSTSRVPPVVNATLDSQFKVFMIINPRIIQEGGKSYASFEIARVEPQTDSSVTFDVYIRVSNAFFN